MKLINRIAPALTLSAMFFLTTAFTWPWDAPQANQGQPNQDENKDKSSTVAPARLQQTEREVTVTPVNKPKRSAAAAAFAGPAGIQPRAISDDKSRVAAPRKQVAIPTIKPERADASAGTGAGTGAPEVQAAAVQSQLDSMMRVNDSLKNNYGQQAAEVQRISDQAKIHQRILTQLSTAPAQPVYSKNDSQELLRQEKIRLIREQTERNRQVLESLNRSRRLPQ